MTTGVHEKVCRVHFAAITDQKGSVHFAAMSDCLTVRKETSLFCSHGWPLESEKSFGEAQAWQKCKPLCFLTVKSVTAWKKAWTDFSEWAVSKAAKQFQYFFFFVKQSLQWICSLLLCIEMFHSFVFHGSVCCSCKQCEIACQVIFWQGQIKNHQCLENCTGPSEEAEKASGSGQCCWNQWLDQHLHQHRRHWHFCCQCITPMNTKQTSANVTFNLIWHECKCLLLKKWEKFSMNWGSAELHAEFPPAIHDTKTLNFEMSFNKSTHCTTNN